MRTHSIGQKAVNPVKISDALPSVLFHSIRNVISDDLVEQTCREVHYDFRKRKMTPVVTVLHMIMAAIWPEESFNACWHVLWDTFVGETGDSHECWSVKRRTTHRIVVRDLRTGGRSTRIALTDRHSGQPPIFGVDRRADGT